MNTNNETDKQKVKKLDKLKNTAKTNLEKVYDKYEKEPQKMFTYTSSQKIPLKAFPETMLSLRKLKSIKKLRLTLFRFQKKHRKLNRTNTLKTYLVLSIKIKTKRFIAHH